MRLCTMSKTNVMFIMYGRELSRPPTCALGLAIADIYVNSFIMDEGALEKTSSPTRYIPNHSIKTLSIIPILESTCLKINIQVT